MRRIPLMAVIVAGGALGAGQATAQSGVSPPAAAPAASDSIDFENAKPMPLPTRPVQDPLATAQVAPPVSGPSGVVGGAKGDGALAPIRVAPAKAISDSGVATQQFGTSKHPFSTARVQLTAPATYPKQLPTVHSYPYRASGRLFFNIGTDTYVCSASLIKRGLVVTAAHCVTLFGSGAYYTNFQFIPAYHNGAAPYGVWTGVPFALASYRNGTDPCTVSGVVCANDVAVIRLTAKTSLPNFPGTSTGWYGYGFGNTGFTTPSFTTKLSTLVDQLGYPVDLDGGEQEQRNDSLGYRDPSNSNSTIIGSLMTGGSSGGPWLNNLGNRPALSGTSFGSSATANMVIGVTSWGYSNPAIKQQGASPFTAGNIVALVNAACGNPVTRAACQ